jgi:hypothetical protein
MNRLCWGFHSGDIPADADEVIDTQDRTWRRAGVRSWRMAVEADQPARFHEQWLLDTFGPVRCPIGERLLEQRDAKLAAQLEQSVNASQYWLPGVGHDHTGMPVAFEDAMALMRAGWLAWSPKQRREALADVREAEEAELVKTS